MILSEKITELRKKNGLSQEALGEKLGVSRQAVSKWEMAQSVPDLNKVIAMADVFGVSTDLLLKDELELADAAASQPLPQESAQPEKTVDLAEAGGYLSAAQHSAKQAAVSAVLLMLSPAAGIMLSALTKENERAGMTGAVIEVLILIGAAIMLILSLNGLSGYRYLKKEPFELGYGVKGAVSERKKAFENTRLTGIITGTVLCLASVLPLMLCSIFAAENDVVIAAGGCIMLMMTASGAAILIRNAVIWHSYKRLLGNKR